jgi:hypothetical protein
MLVDTELTNDGHTHRFSVTHTREGWEILEKEDDEVVCRRHRHDWHSVETEVRRFRMKADDMRRHGWRDS